MTAGPPNNGPAISPVEGRAAPTLGNVLGFIDGAVTDSELPLVGDAIKKLDGADRARAIEAGKKKRAEIAAKKQREPGAEG